MPYRFVAKGSVGDTDELSALLSVASIGGYLGIGAVLRWP